MHPSYTELSRALSQACRALVDQYGAPDFVRSPYTQVKVSGNRYRIEGPQLKLQSRDGQEWHVTRARAAAAAARWQAATLEDLQEGERIVSDLALLAVNGAWLKKADNSIKRLKAILRALDVA